MNQFVIIAGEMRDVDYTSVYGPFATEAEAETGAALLVASGVIEIETDDCLEFRIVPVLDPENARLRRPTRGRPDDDGAVRHEPSDEVGPMTVEHHEQTIPHGLPMPDFSPDDDPFAAMLKAAFLAAAEPAASAPHDMTPAEVARMGNRTFPPPPILTKEERAAYDIVMDGFREELGLPAKAISEH